MNKTPTRASWCLHKGCFSRVPEVIWGSYKLPHWTEGNRQTSSAHQKTTGSQVKSHLQLQTPMPDAVCSQLSKLLRSLSHQKLFGGRRIAMASCDIAPSNFSLILPLRSLLLLYLNNKALCCPSAFRTSSLPNHAQLFTFHKTGLSSSC